ncbi:formyltransferase family protein [Natrarchaeobius oligotrophus]|uniref:phosphoribosylglycinamide formyltransferase 1 n=1 Tax=Natrarchaeobius chitinivorans TaxID=1679083 RepID=A0A3N6MNV0_NATCH|nr:formyltransferase family protein [Natrarchaeobius chitinivorans]RQG96176.1 hypothetical protein EA472_20840 [Natrarchaeobius chitinivorans]
MTSVPSRDILVLLSSNGLKSRIVLEHLLEDSWFVDQFDLGAVVDRTDGEVPKILSEANVPHEVASAPKTPVEEMLDVFPNGPEYIVSVGWSHYVPPDAIELALIESLNCHGSYLPEYRGPNAYRATWANGRETGGASVHVMTDEFDDGRIIRRERFNIGPFDTPREIGYRASELTAGLVRESILLIESGYEGIENEGGSYYERISWPKTIVHGCINNLARLSGVDWRWEIDPR